MRLGRQDTAKTLTRDEAPMHGAAIAKLPDPRPENAACSEGAKHLYATKWPR